MCRIHTNLRIRKGPGAPSKADACTLLASALPIAHQIMTAAQMEQLQAVLDAGGNPASKSVLVDKWALASSKLLTSDAFDPTTNNPDEAAYLGEIRQILLQKGVWLRIDERPLRMRLPPLLFLSLGQDGDEIPTKDGRLTRENLLGNRVLGAGYESKVNQGASRRAELQKSIKRLRRDLEAGVEHHRILLQLAKEDNPAVLAAKLVWGGRGLGGFPDSSMWDKPRELMEIAEQLYNAGDLTASRAISLKASILTAKAAKEISAYFHDTNVGGERAVAFLEWVEIAGAWAGLFASGGGGPARGGSAGKTSATVRAAPPVTRAPVAFAQTNYRGRAAMTRTVNQGGGTLNTTGAGASAINRINRYDAAARARIAGWHDDVVGELLKNPNGTLAEKLQILRRADAKWGNPMEFLH